MQNKEKEVIKKLEIATADTYLTGIIVKLLFLSAKFIAESAEEQNYARFILETHGFSVPEGNIKFFISKTA